MTPRQKQRQMGDVSNLITDMTIKGASPDEIARAVRHSMVVIDAEKHKLNWRQSRIDNGIPALKKKYQGSARSGASTLVSRASSEERVNERRQHVGINPRTGEKEYKETGRSYIRRKTMKDGTVKETKIFNQTKSTKMAEAKDAYELIDGSGTAIERVYADHANKLKSLGNQARLSMIKTKPHKYSPATAVKYKKELTSLDNKLKLAKKNAPLERRAQLIGGHIYKERLRQNPDMSTADKKKERGRALVVARTRVGAEKPRIKITPREWEAIQLGGVTKTRLQEILLHTDADEVRTYATPKTTPTMSTSKVSRAKQLLNAGYTIAEVSHAVGVSQSQIANIEND